MDDLVSIMSLKILSHWDTVKFQWGQITIVNDTTRLSLVFPNNYVFAFKYFFENTQH